MMRALRLAERGRGSTSPNPMVGALIVDDAGVVVGRGAHLAAGGPHAEIHALADAGPLARGATLYCTLEPCSHSGRTGPCAPRVADAGVRRAVIAIEDPNPLVAGRGLELLRARGVEVTLGVGGAEAARLNRPFLTRMQQQRPHVTIKVALSRDGRVAAGGGVHTALTGAAADRLMHRERAEIDALAVGSGTILADDPRLTARVAYRSRPLLRVVFDRRLRTPPAARLFSTLSEGPVIIMTGAAADDAHHRRAGALAAAGATVQTIVHAPGAGEFLTLALRSLSASGVTSAVVEGGPTIHEALLAAGLVDRLELLVTPRVLGDGATAWVRLAKGRIAALAELTVATVGDDVLIEGHVHRVD